jgi:hypothetical protein
VYGVNDAVYNELIDYFDSKNFSLQPPPHNGAFERKGSRIPFQIYEGNSGWRIEVAVWNGGEEEELISVFDMSKNVDMTYRLQYLYTGC